jgi:hypothetical protein
MAFIFLLDSEMEEGQENPAYAKEEDQAWEEPVKGRNH